MPDVPSSLGSVLVVGGCGFLGHRIVRQLLDLHPTSSLSVLDIKTDRARLPSVSYHTADISSLEQVKSLLRQIRPDVVIHTAAPTAFIHDMSFLKKWTSAGHETSWKLRKRLTPSRHSSTRPVPRWYTIPSVTWSPQTRRPLYCTYLCSSPSIHTPKHWQKVSYFKQIAIMVTCSPHLFDLRAYSEKTIPLRWSLWWKLQPLGNTDIRLAMGSNSSIGPMLGMPPEHMFKLRMPFLMPIEKALQRFRTSVGSTAKRS